MIAELARKILDGERSALAQGITLVESQLASDQNLAEELLNRCLKSGRRAPIIGVSGMPGVGKSSFIEKLGLHWIADRRKVAVLAVDPSSPKTGGSILGDKTRMEELSRSSQSFIRPSPSGESHGGIARRTKDAAKLCEAAGYDIIIIESVGVGQAEYNLASACDFFLVMQLPGSGDDLQGIKKGILEMADAIVVHKADGQLRLLAETAKVEHERALQMLGTSHIPVFMCSSISGDGLLAIAQWIIERTNIATPAFDERRQREFMHDLKFEIQHLAQQHFAQWVARQPKDWPPHDQLSRTLAKQIFKQIRD